MGGGSDGKRVRGQRDKIGNCRHSTISAQTLAVTRAEGK